MSHIHSCPTFFEIVDIPLDDNDYAVETKLRKRFKTQNGIDDVDLHGQFDWFISQTPSASSVEFCEVDTKSICGWWCYPRTLHSNKAMLYLHGGGYTRGSANAYRNFSSHIAERTGIATFVLDYPLAPETTAPAPLHKIIEAVHWLKAGGHSMIALIGDSAGGGLALAGLAALDQSILHSVVVCVVFSPWTDLSLSGASINDPDIDDPLLSYEALAQSAAEYVGDIALTDPLVSPLFASNAITTPLLIQVGSDEILLDDARRFASNAHARGAPVRLEIWKGLHHVFQLDLVDLKSSQQALDHAARFLIAAFGTV